MCILSTNRNTTMTIIFNFTSLFWSLVLGGGGSLSYETWSNTIRQQCPLQFSVRHTIILYFLIFISCIHILLRPTELRCFSALQRVPVPPQPTGVACLLQERVLSCKLLLLSAWREQARHTGPWRTDRSLGNRTSMLGSSELGLAGEGEKGVLAVFRPRPCASSDWAPNRQHTVQASRW